MPEEVCSLRKDSDSVAIHGAVIYVFGEAGAERPVHVSGDLLDFFEMDFGGPSSHLVDLRRKLHRFELLFGFLLGFQAFLRAERLVIRTNVYLRWLSFRCC